MSSISLSFKMLLGAGALAGMTLLACGEEDSGGGGKKDDDEENEEDNPRDAGRDARTTRNDAQQDIEYVKEGEACDPEEYMGLGSFGGPCQGCGQNTCFARCVDGEYGECKTTAELLAELGGDGGLEGILGRDASIPNPLGDASIKKTDGGVSIDLGNDAGSINVPAMECPAETECSSNSTNPLAGIISSLAMGLPFCAAPTGLPPTCTTANSATECQEMGFKAAICVDALGFGKYCLQTCQ